MRSIIVRMLRGLYRSVRKISGKTGLELNNEKGYQVLRQVEEFMQQSRPFLKPGYNIQKLAGVIGIPSYQLSALINRQVGINFNDYLNRYRVKYCEELIQNGEAANLNLKGLANNCGFHNRNTFTIAFKKFTGVAPSNYTKYYKHCISVQAKCVMIGKVARSDAKSN
jgi:AraC-like DNA-binding protein